MDDESRRLTYYGYSFESYCTRTSSDISTSSIGWGGDVDTNVQWYSVVKTKLNDMRIIIGGEVVCVRDQYIGEPDTFVELKTSMDQRNDKKRWETKLLKFFTQSFLLGVPEIFVGFRDRQGLLRSTASFQTASIPRLVRNGTRQWDPQTCQSWAYQALRHIRGVISQDSSGPDAVWRIKFEPYKGLSLRRLSAHEVEFSVVCGEERIGILPRRYWDAIISY